MNKLDVTRIRIMSLPKMVKQLFESGVLELHLNTDNFKRSDCVDYSLPYKIDFINLPSRLDETSSATPSTSLLQ
jgi:hypothetical protein